MENILITSNGIIKTLKNFKPLDSICEYIWNGFDAGANEVRVEFFTNEFDIITGLEIKDNGSGISFDELDLIFKPFHDSQKFKSTNTTNQTIPHGRNGKGRLTFFTFS